MMLTDIFDQLETMMHQEVTTYKTVDYLSPGFQQKLAIEEETKQPVGALCDAVDDSSSSSSSSPRGITERWREKMCEWCYQVVDHFDFSREVVSIAMHYLDRYLAKRLVNKRIFQLAAMVSLSLAVKLFEPCKLCMSSMIELSRGHFTVKQMEAMELSLMKDLQWSLHPPTAYGIMKHLLYLLPIPNTLLYLRHDILELSRFLSELGVMDYFFVSKRLSHVAVASIANALQDIASVPHQTRCDFVDLLYSLNVDLDDPDIVDCRHRLRLLFVQGGYAPPSTQQDRLDTTPSPPCVSMGQVASPTTRPTDRLELKQTVNFQHKEGP